LDEIFIYSFIEISHVSDIEKNVVIVLPVSQSKRRTFIIKPLVAAKPKGKSIDEKELAEWGAKFSIVETQEDIDALTKTLSESNFDKESKKSIMDFYNLAVKKIGEAKK